MDNEWWNDVMKSIDVHEKKIKKPTIKKDSKSDLSISVMKKCVKPFQADDSSITSSSNEEESWKKYPYPYQNHQCYLVVMDRDSRILRSFDEYDWKNVKRRRPYDGKSWMTTGIGNSRNKFVVIIDEHKNIISGYEIPKKEKK